MNLTLKRKILSKVSSIGELSIDGKFFCYTLEDLSRDLYQTSPIEEINSKKVHGQTAIPYGKYNVIITYSNRFKRELPLLENVPGFEGIRIHSGNNSASTEGCVLVGDSYSKDYIYNSRITFDKLFLEIKNCINIRKEPVTIEITK